MNAARAVLDACVLYPTVLREILLDVARCGLYRPLWSARLLEEWARAIARDEALGRAPPGAEAQVRAEIALLRDAFPGAEVAPAPALEARLYLPDANDLHVLAAAIKGSADVIVTANATDFPRHLLAEEGIARQDPDQFLHGLWLRAPEPVAAAAEGARARAAQLSGQDQDLRALLKRARLPRLGKAIAGAAASGARGR